jgi:hypothetical protein
MAMKSILKDGKFSVGLIAVTAGTTDQDTGVYDMSGYDSIAFLLLTGDATSGTVLELQVFGNTASSTSSPTPTQLTSSSATYTSASATDADSKLLVVDVYKPSYRYIFARCKRGTQNCVLGGIVAIQYNARTVPTTQDATVLASALLGPLA